MGKEICKACGGPVGKEKVVPTIKGEQEKIFCSQGCHNAYYISYLDNSKKSKGVKK